MSGQLVSDLPRLLRVSLSCMLQIEEDSSHLTPGYICLAIVDCVTLGPNPNIHWERRSETPKFPSFEADAREFKGIHEAHHRLIHEQASKIQMKDRAVTQAEESEIHRILTNKCLHIW